MPKVRFAPPNTNLHAFIINNKSTMGCTAGHPYWMWQLSAEKGFSLTSSMLLHLHNVRIVLKPTVTPRRNKTSISNMASNRDCWMMKWIKEKVTTEQTAAELYHGSIFLLLGRLLNKFRVDTTWLQQSKLQQRPPASSSWNFLSVYLRCSKWRSTYRYHCSSYLAT